MSTPYQNEIAKNATPLIDLAPLIDTLKNKKVVMLGESSHGTKEFYEWRRVISKELILNHGFNFIAVEGDWPACQKINEYIKNKEVTNVDQVLANFSRWPTWMWANQEVAKLAQWLKFYNNNKPTPVEFFGLDVYSLYESIDQTLLQLSKFDKDLADKARTYYSCFDPYRHDEKAYARSLFKLPEGCKNEVLLALKEILYYRLKTHDKNNSYLFDAVQNARIVRNADRYYHAMVFGEEDSWNVRDYHMMDTLDMLMGHYGPEAKGIVWEHNTHIGDYRATDMLQNGHVNLGGLAREKYGEHEVALVGFTTYAGKVTAAFAWDGLVQFMTVPEGKARSVEAEFHEAVKLVGHPNYYTLFDKENISSPLFETRGHRAIGVVYHPNSEHRGNYVPTSLSRRYDAMIFIDQTQALQPIAVHIDFDKIPETYPFGARM